jgi:hypothetical protein
MSLEAIRFLSSNISHAGGGVLSAARIYVILVVNIYNGLDEDEYAQKRLPRERRPLKNPPERVRRMDLGAAG